MKIFFKMFLPYIILISFIPFFLFNNYFISTFYFVNLLTLLLMWNNFLSYNTSSKILRIFILTLIFIYCIANQIQFKLYSLILAFFISLFLEHKHKNFSNNFVFIVTVTIIFPIFSFWLLVLVKLIT